MFLDPFTNNDDFDSMLILQAQQQAEYETDYLTTMKEYDMATTPKEPTTKKKLTAAKKPEIKKSETKPAAPETKKKSPLGPRVIPAGFIGLEALAKECGTTAAAARRKFRAQDDFPKPEGGWVFKEGSKLLADARKILTKKD